MNPALQNSPSPSRSRFAGSLLCVALCALGGNALAQTAPAPSGGNTADETVKLPTFSVSTERDYGYRASNSIAGSRTNTPIKDLPVNIQVFTKDLFDDLGLTNQVDLEAYNGSLVNGGADRNSTNAIQQAYNAFLFRGFQQNWGLRDGIREYDPVDLQLDVDAPLPTAAETLHVCVTGAGELSAGAGNGRLAPPTPRRSAALAAPRRRARPAGGGSPTSAGSTLPRRRTGSEPRQSAPCGRGACRSRFARPCA